MNTRSTLRSSVIAIAAVLFVAPGVLADTCCANLRIGLSPQSAGPGDVVRLIGLRCLNPDNTGPLPLNLGAFWLSTGRRPADGDPGSAPGLGLPAPVLPPLPKWFAFRSVTDPAATSGEATIAVPDLPNGSYQLWWWCDDGSGPGGGLHYSTGPRLAIRTPPDTSTVAEAPGRSGTSGLPMGLVMPLLGFVVFVGCMRWGPFGTRATRARRSYAFPRARRAREVEWEEHET